MKIRVVVSLASLLLLAGCFEAMAQRGSAGGGRGAPGAPAGKSSGSAAAAPKASAKAAPHGTTQQPKSFSPQQHVANPANTTITINNYSYGYQYGSPWRIWWWGPSYGWGWGDGLVFCKLSMG